MLEWRSSCGGLQLPLCFPRVRSVTGWSCAAPSALYVTNSIVARSCCHLSLPRPPPPPSCVPGSPSRRVPCGGAAWPCACVGAAWPCACVGAAWSCACKWEWRVGDPPPGDAPPAAVLPLHGNALSKSPDNAGVASASASASRPLPACACVGRFGTSRTDEPRESAFLNRMLCLRELQRSLASAPLADADAVAAVTSMEPSASLCWRLMRGVTPVDSASPALLVRICDARVVWGRSTRCTIPTSKSSVEHSYVNKDGGRRATVWG
mmetsp:Transcript_37194/g.109732  ORF Transcript_37194/g.109732 Transcript_37194/m.109732 type:complete len:265 (+) Transcript_37194:141-935(+)